MMRSTPKRPYYFPLAEEFIPERRIGIGIFNVNYNNTGDTKLEQVRGDSVRVEEIFKSLGIKKEDTTLVFDPSYKDLNDLFTKLRLKY